MENKRISGFTCLLTLVTILFMVTSTMPLVLAQGSRTGDLDNQPVTGYKEGPDLFKIHHGNGIHNTSFTSGETVTINITTNRLSDIQNKAQLRVKDWQANNLIDVDPAFVVTDSVGPTYSYEATFDATGGNGFTNDHYLIEIDVRANNGERFQAWDTIVIDGGATTPKYIKTFTDSDFTNMDWVFNTDEIIYIEVWTGGATQDAGNSDVEFSNYQNDNDNTGLDGLDNNTVTINGNYVRIAYDLSNDLDTQAVTVTEGWWYNLQVDLRDNGGGDVVRRWTIQIYINIRPAIGDVGATPISLDVIGTGTTTIHAHFTDLDAPTVGAFTITMAVREPDDLTIVLLVDAQTDGNGGLTIADLGGGEFNATFNWDPADNQAIGLYDISVSIRDSKRGVGNSGYGTNSNELTLFNSLLNPPQLVVGDLTADPATVGIAGTSTTTIHTNFTDTDDADASTFFVSFWIRDDNMNVIVLANDKANGGTGNFGVQVIVTKTGVGEYTSSIDFDPDNTVPVSLYDLYFKVVDGDAQIAEDDFGANQDELEITSGDNDPKAIDVSATPGTIDKMGNQTTVLSGRFTDDDNHGVGSFLISFEVRDPAGDKIDIAKDVQDTGVGEFGEVLTIVKVGVVYFASIAWDPADTVLRGYYDLKMKVEDPTERKDDSNFNDNPDELLITSSNHPPMIIAGNTWADLDIVVRTGGNTTVLNGNFTDGDMAPVSSFKVTFKVRSPSNVETVVVNKKFNGEASQFGRTVKVEMVDDVYFATIEWDPPDNIETGRYDLHFSVSDAFNDMAEDLYSNNEDELNIIDSIEPPKIKAGKTKAQPATVNRDGSDKTVIIGEFEDNTFVDPGDFKVSFKVRDTNGNEIVLANDKANAEVAVSGGIVTISTTGKGFEARLAWDPPGSAIPGPYDLFFSVRNDAGARASDIFSNNLDELMVTIGQPPVISDLTANPAKVVVQGLAKTTISALFTDSDAAGGGEFIVTFKVRDPVGTKITLVNGKFSGGAGEFGNILNVASDGGTYNATYAWDPPETMANGLYDLEVEIEDAGGLKDKNDFDANLDELELTGGISPGTPSIIPSPPSNSENDYTFIVTYVDLENDAPDAKGLRIEMDGKEYIMMELDDKDKNYVDGKKYFLVLSLDKGDHDYHFTVTDDSGLSATTDPDTVKVTTGGSGGGSDVESPFSLLLIVLVLFLIVVIIMMGVMMSRRRSPPVHGYPPAETHEEAGPVESDPEPGTETETDDGSDDSKSVGGSFDGATEGKVSDSEIKPVSDTEPKEDAGSSSDTEKIMESLKDI